MRLYNKLQGRRIPRVVAAWTTGKPTGMGCALAKTNPRPCVYVHMHASSPPLPRSAFRVLTAVLSFAGQVVVDDIKALLAGRPLPYKGFDMFDGEDHNIKGQIEIDG